MYISPRFNRRRTTMKKKMLHEKRPDLTGWYDHQANSISFSLLSPASNKKRWWVCDRGHKFQCSPNKLLRKAKYLCTECKGEDNSLATLYPSHAAQWHPSKNGKITPVDISKGSNKKFYWLCNYGHSFQRSPKHKIRSFSFLDGWYV